MRGALLAISVLATACSFGALNGFSGGEGTDAGVDASAPDASVDAPSTPDASTTLCSGASCAAIKEANSSAVDGRYRIVPADTTVAPFDAYCDMTKDGGGWMRVTAEMIVDEKKLSTTSVHDVDDDGALVLRAYANSRGCGMSDPNLYVALIRDVPKWTRLRARYDFYGSTTCWAILGDTSGEAFATNLIPFEKTVDVARDMLKMGGSNGDAFDGRTDVCENATTNFWDADPSVGRRSIVAILRRSSPDLVAGPGTFASCTTVASGVSSPTYWEYRQIYVR